MKRLLHGLFFAFVGINTVACNGGGATGAVSSMMSSTQSSSSGSVATESRYHHSAASSSATGVASSDVPSHMMTYAVLPGDFHNSSSSDFQILGKYVNFLETDTRASNVAHAAGIKVGFYTDPNRPHGDDENAWPSDAYAHDCNGNVVIAGYPGALEHVGHMGSSALNQAWDNEIKSHQQDQYNSYTQDFVRSDDSGNPAEAWEVYFQNVLGGVQETLGQPYCHYSDASYVSGLRALYAQAPLPVIFNGDTSTEYNAYMQNAPNILGSQCESCFVGTSTDTWVKEVNAEIGAVALHKVFNSFSHGPYTSQQQIYLYASMLLGFDPSYVSLYTDNMNAPSGVDISPLVSLVPMQPTATASDVSQYLSSEGNYVRQFGQCYVKQVSVGPCAVAVNSDSSSHPFPSSLAQYHHAATFSGAGIITEFGDNGAVNVNGGTPPSSIPGQQAVIVFQ